MLEAKSILDSGEGLSKCKVRSTVAERDEVSGHLKAGSVSVNGLTASSLHFERELDVYYLTTKLDHDRSSKYRHC